MPNSFSFLNYNLIITFYGNELVYLSLDYLGELINGYSWHTGDISLILFKLEEYIGWYSLLGEPWSDFIRCY